MRFARIVFRVAGILGLLIVVPMFFTIEQIGRDFPPAITHPDFYYGFLLVTVAWQIVFLIISTDPVRFRPLMLAALLEKFPYVAMLLLLYSRGQLPSTQLIAAGIDGTLGVLFVYAYLKTPRE